MDQLGVVLHTHHRRKCACHIKHFQALAYRFRHPLTLYYDVFHVVAAIVNRRTRLRLAQLCA